MEALLRKDRAGSSLARQGKGLPSDGRPYREFRPDAKPPGLAGMGLGRAAKGLWCGRIEPVTAMPARTIGYPGGKCHGTALRPSRRLHLVRRQAGAVGRRDAARAFARAALRELRVRRRTRLWGL